MKYLIVFLACTLLWLIGRYMLGTIFVGMIALEREFGIEFNTEGFAFRIGSEYDGNSGLSLEFYFVNWVVYRSRDGRVVQFGPIAVIF